MKSAGVSVVRLGPQHVDEILEISARCGLPKTNPESVLIEIRKSFANFIGVREPNGSKMIAYCNYWIVAQEVQLLAIATLPAWRRRGYGTALYEALIAEAKRTDCRSITLEVRRSNQAAISLYHRVGFRKVGVRKGYYPDGEDALLMTNRI